MLPRFLLTISLLFILWILLSGHIHDPLLLGLGAISCLITAWFTHRLALANSDLSTLRLNINLPKFLPWFIIEIIKSNLHVCKLILQPKLAIDPKIFTVPVSKHNHVAKAVYANCITLTPGTYSLDVNPDNIVVHALTSDIANDLQKGEMGKRILSLQTKQKKD